MPERDAEIEALKAENVRLRTALKPFGRLYEDHTIWTNFGTSVPYAPDEYITWGVNLRVGDLREARDLSGIGASDDRA